MSLSCAKEAYWAGTILKGFWTLCGWTTLRHLDIARVSMDPPSSGETSGCGWQRLGWSTWSGWGQTTGTWVPRAREAGRTRGCTPRSTPRRPAPCRTTRSMPSGALRPCATRMRLSISPSNPLSTWLPFTGTTAKPWGKTSLPRWWRQCVRKATSLAARPTSASTRAAALSQKLRATSWCWSAIIWASRLPSPWQATPILATS